MRLKAVFFAVALAIASVAPPTGAAEPEPLKPGDSIFRDGSYVDTVEEDGVFTETDTLETTDGGYRLRVALDLLLSYKQDGKEHMSADQGRRFEVVLRRGEVGSQDPGVEVVSGSTEGGAASATGPPWGYSVELVVCFEKGAGCDPQQVLFCAVGAVCDGIGDRFGCDADGCTAPTTELVEGPSSGRWTIEVTARPPVDGWSYRTRAALERPPSPPDERADRFLSPNLRAIPPFELTLDCTSAMGSGAGTRTGVCGGDVVPQRGFGCTQSELAEYPKDVTRCLRFSGGEEVEGAQPGSAGDGGGGDLEIEGRNASTDPNGRRIAQAVQIRRAPDGSIHEHAAGQLEFHDQHNHWHYEGFIKYQLFQVTGDTETDSPPPKKLISARDPGTKRGWGPVDERMADWFHFNQGIQPFGQRPPCSSPCNPRLYQTVGWGDSYEWPVEQQGVPIATDDDPLTEGDHYLLRVEMDKENQLLESDEDDNASYAYFEVTGPRSLRIVERGYGFDPWDPHKTVVLP